ncbi:MAG: alpha-L-fucosidase [Phycisphaerae bacterium]|nr:alpha-L-fucosidase [Phycisphaerae bacterium]
MMNRTEHFMAPLIAILFSAVLPAMGQTQVNERAQWFVDARFGMFIHWGIYSGAEGIWKGENHRHGNNYAEWIQYRNQIDQKEYLTLLDRFDWDAINPEQWVLLAKQSGMKYVTLTAKHHDGFALWDSQASHYDVAEFSHPKRDIVGELAAACQKHGLKLGLYYSHWVDWDHPYGWDHTKEITGISPEQYDQYWQEKVMPQMRELLTQYGPIGIIWFDMWIHHSQTVVTKTQLLQLKGLIRELQPDCLVNSRLGLSVEEDSDVDFQTLGDNQFGSQKKDFPWQSPGTVAHSWGFNTLDTQWKSTTSLLLSLINNVSLNGNFMLNIGPKANGEIPFEISQRLRDMGQWLKVNGDSIYGSHAFDLPRDQHDWGSITCKTKRTGTTLYLHVLHWPFHNQLYLTGVTTKPQTVYLLADKQKARLVFKHSVALTTINLPVTQPDPYVSVVVVEYGGHPDIVEGLVAKTRDGGFSLTPLNIAASSKQLSVQGPARQGTVPTHVTLRDSTHLQWRIYVDEPGSKTLDLSYSYQGQGRLSRTVFKAANATVSQAVIPTGKTVGEPRSNWIIDRFKSHRLGTVNFPESGYYDIDLDILPEQGEEVKFQWLWVR